MKKKQTTFSDMNVTPLFDKRMKKKEIKRVSIKELYKHYHEATNN